MTVYFAPTLEPERTTPPGNGMITARGTLRMAATRLLAGGERCREVFGQHQEVAAADGLRDPGRLLATNSPSITGTRQ